MAAAKAAAGGKELAQLRSEVTTLTNELAVVAERVPCLGRLLPPAPSSSGDACSLSADDLLLSVDEVQEAALRACWLAHYWSLARDLGIMPEVAGAQVERWSSASPPDDVLHMCAADIARRIAERYQDHAPTASPSTESTNRAHRSTACVVDMVELERAVRRCSALGVVQSVRSTLALAAQEGVSAVQHSVEQLDDLDDPAPSAAQTLSHPAAAREVAFCASWLAYTWGRAALANVQSQVSMERAEQWAARLGRPARLCDFADIEASFQELDVYDIETLLWRHR